MVSSGQADKYTIWHFTQIYNACEDAIRIPNHQGTLPMHNMFALSWTDPCEQGDMLLMFKMMLDSFPSAVLCPSCEFQGATPFHTMFPAGALSAAKAVLRSPIRDKSAVDSFQVRIEYAI